MKHQNTMYVSPPYMEYEPTKVGFEIKYHFGPKLLLLISVLIGILILVSMN